VINREGSGMIHCAVENVGRLVGHDKTRKNAFVDGRSNPFVIEVHLLISPKSVSTVKHIQLNGTCTVYDSLEFH
jgi:hypothetical protein